MNEVILLKNEIYEQAQKILSERRSRAISENDMRIQEINSKIPEIKEVNTAIFNTGKELIRTVLAGGSSDIQAKIEQIKNSNLGAQELCRKMLVANGYPADYLDVQFTCKKCSDTGSYNAAMCDCMKQLCGKLMAESLNKNAQLTLSSFDTFSLSYYSGDDYATMQRIYNFARTYAENFTPSSGSILMFGATGLGKTHLSLAIANEVLKKGYSVLYDSTINILNKIKKEDFSYEKETEMYDTVMDAELLILDDLGTEFENKMYTSTIYNIINTRLNRVKPTIISTNLDFKKIAERYDDRVASRLNTMYTCLEFHGDDVRLQQKKQNTIIKRGV